MTQVGDYLKNRSSAVVVYFAEIETTVPVYAWSGMRPYETGGKLYYPTGAIGTLGETIKTDNVQVNSMSMGYHVAALKQNATYDEFIARLRTKTKEDVSGVRFTTFWAVMRDDGELLGGLQPRDRGVLSHASSQIEPGSATAALATEPIIGGLIRKTAAQLNDQDQQRISSGDRFCEFVPIQSAGLTIQWDPVA